MTEDREIVDANVRRIVGIAALRRIHRIIADREEGDRVLRKLIAPVATLLMIVIAALIWHFGSPQVDPDTDPAVDSMPMCSPPAGERISI